MISLRAHEERVIGEQAVNSEKLKALDGFIGTSSIFKDLAEKERELLVEQSEAMHKLDTILQSRIALFIRKRN